MVQEESCWTGSWKPHWISFILFFILTTIAIPASKETACCPSLSNTALRLLKSHWFRIAVMKTSFLKTLPYFVFERGNLHFQILPVWAPISQWEQCGQVSLWRVLNSGLWKRASMKRWSLSSNGRGSAQVEDPCWRFQQEPLPTSSTAIYIDLNNFPRKLRIGREDRPKENLSINFIYFFPFWFFPL